MSASGRVNGSAIVSAALGGQPLAVTLNTTTDSTWIQQWRTAFELVSTGADQLTVSALHPSGQFTTNRSVWFTNNIAYETATDTYDAAGQLTQPSGRTRTARPIAPRRSSITHFLWSCAPSEAW